MMDNQADSTVKRDTSAREAYSERYEDALRLAATAHQRQRRKGSDLPYITHPFHVSVILLRHGFPIDVAIAGMLHDVVEDQDIAPDQIEGRFGERVAEIVVALSERKSDTRGAKRPWEVRKREALEYIRRASPEAVAVKAADTLHNARCTVLDVRREGPEVWGRFTRGHGPTLDYYRRILHIARERLPGHPLVDELAGAIEDFARLPHD